MKKNIFIAFAALAITFSICSAQDKKTDWAQFYKYEQANTTVTAKPKAVFMGDSITEGWFRLDPDFFTSNNFLGRGISGQTSSEMLVRFRRDVLDFHPKYVVILAGTNDAAENNGKITPENTLGNIISMCELAKLHKIKPILCSALPAGQFRWRKEITDAPDRVRTLNALLKDYAKKNRIVYLDYYPLMDDGNGSLPETLSKDTVHPTLEGYKIMEEAVLKVLR
jgi:alpha-L-fucosidase